MKTNVMKKGMLLLMGAGLLFTSCSQDDNETSEESVSAEITAERTQQSTEAEIATDELFNVMDIAYAEQEEEAGRNASYFPSCVTITVSMQNGVKFVTLDFGLGCQLNNGAIVSGIIYLTYNPSQAGTVTIEYDLENFAHNNKFIAGGGSLFRERNNANGNPQHTVNHDLEVTFPNGLVIDIDGTRVSEWIEGVGSGTWEDNAFLVTGNRDIQFSTGFSHYAIVIDPLRREATCPHFVSGTVEITRNNGTGLLDFGDGTCDNLATLTVNGETYTIILN
ncbi:hypothetical protein POV27_04230 [Aureisphaera galaxeae]|uniref:hypothetical protein n=1 Tax=Aureisphaera galaxeae TaxID=1538023 RepID=UPI0023501A95|nr:hypothetical protein [Aureisphaera galaxeae]MDC8003243.1 hypothetical protein [Aureisphaera galaxeae]